MILVPQGAGEAVAQCLERLHVVVIYSNYILDRDFFNNLDFNYKPSYNGHYNIFCEVKTVVFFFLLLHLFLLPHVVVVIVVVFVVVVIVVVCVV